MHVRRTSSCRKGCSAARGKRLVLGLVAISLFVAGPVVNIGGPETVLAAETGQQVDIEARRLQLEGTQLQLKGDLKGALDKYRQSLKLKSNERLERLVGKLEKQAVKRGIDLGQDQGGEKPTPEVSGEAPAVAPQPEEPSSVVPENGEQELAGGQQEEKEVPARVEHNPATPQEALVYDFVDWAMGELSCLAEQGELTLDAQRDYRLIHEGESYQVRLEPFALRLDDAGDRLIDIAPLQLTCRPRGEDLLEVKIELPQRIGFLNEQEEKFALVHGSQNLNLTWDRRHKSFPATDLALTDFKIDFSKSPSYSPEEAALGVALLSFSSSLAADEKGDWTEKYQGAVKDFLFKDGDATARIKSIAFEAEGKGGDLDNYQLLKDQYGRLVEVGEDMKLEDVKDLSRLIDRYLSTLVSSKGSIQVDGVSMNPEGVMALAHAEITGTMVRKQDDGHFEFQGKGVFRDFSYTGEEAEDPVKVTLANLTLSDSLRINPVPKDFFSGLYDTLAKADAMEDRQAQEDFLGKMALEYGKQFLSLIGAGAVDLQASGFQAVNVMPQPVTLGKAAIGSSFDTGDGSGGTIDFRMNFSDFAGLDQGEGTIPQAAALNIKLDKIPSLLDLIDNPEALVQGDPDQLQGQVMMNGMNLLMASGLNLSLMDSFIAFADSRLDVGLKAKVDQDARYMSTGSLDISVQNPDKLSEIVRGLGIPQVEQFLATLTALANRADKNGTVVDRIQARLTPEGKIMVNSKDVTGMFFPQAQAGVQNEPGTVREETGEQEQNAAGPAPAEETPQGGGEVAPQQ